MTSMAVAPGRHSVRTADLTRSSRLDEMRGHRDRISGPLVGTVCSFCGNLARLCGYNEQRR